MSSSDPKARQAGPVRSSWRVAIRGNVLMMGLVSFFTDAASEMIYPLLPVFLVGVVPVSAAAVYLGLMEGIAEATASLLKIFSGRLSDAIGRRKILVIIGYGLSTICRPLMGAAMVGWQVVALRFVDRIGKGIRTSPRDALISSSVGPDAWGLAFGFHRAMDHAGAVLGPVAAAGILYAFLHYGLWSSTANATVTADQMHALRWLFGISLIPGLVAMAVLIGKVREISPRRPTPAGEQSSKAPNARLPRRFYFFVSIVTLFALGNSSDLFLLLYGKMRFGFGIVQLLGLWVMLHVSKIIFSIPCGVLSDRFGRRGIIIAGWGVYAMVYLGMAAVGSPWQFLALFVAYGLYYGMTEGVQKAMVADFVSDEHRGTAYGLYHGAVGLAALPASLLFGVFWAVVGPRVAFGIGAALAALAAVLLLVLVSTTPPKAKRA